MSQVIWSTINPAATSGTQLAQLLNDFKEAVVSGLSGTSRPSELDAGGRWIDTTNEGSPNFYWSYKIYTGVADVEVFRLNLATSKVSFSGADTTFELTRYTEDAVGPIFKFVKRRVSNNGGLEIGDVIGSVEFIGRGSNSSNPVVAYMECVASDEFDGTKSGGYLRWFTTVEAAATAVEHMRLVDGFLGIGTQAPDASLHTRGSSGIKSERVEDTDAGAKITISKSRSSGTGASQNNDVLGDLEIVTTDDTTKVVSARIRTKAIENHLSTARGTEIEVLTTNTGGTTPASKVKIGDKVETVVVHRTNADEIVSQNVATTATIAQLSATKRVVEFTGSTATSVQGINSGHDSKVILLHNRSTAIVTLAHENGSASAADRLKLPSGAPLILIPETSIELYYCTTDTRWKVKSIATGAGGGGGGAGMDWYMGDANSPEESVLSNGLRIVKFYGSPDEQEMFVQLPVPLTYNAGTQIKIQSGKLFASPTTGNVLMQAVTYIMKAAVDGTSTPTGHTSTNSQVAVAGTTNQIVEIGDIDLTNSTGQINSVAVAAGDTLLVKLTRKTSSETSGLAGVANVIRSSFQPKFTA